MANNMGSDGFEWFVGVVEDRHDPQKLGRVRVRAVGTHTTDKTRIKTDDLPWAHVMQPVSSNAMAGIGESPVNLVEGTWVVGFFRDVESRQELVIMGTLPGYNVTTARTEIPKGVVNRGVFKEDAETYDDISGQKVTKPFNDYEWGFFDPTKDLSTVPFEPASETYIPAKSDGGGDVTAIAEDKDTKIPSYTEVPIPPTALSTKASVVGTHSAGLVDTFTTTRRLTIDKLLDSGKSYAEGLTAATDLSGDPTAGSKPLVVSTGYLQAKDTQGTEGAWWPLTMEKATADRIPHPRVEYALKSALTTTQEDEIKLLFEEGIYGPKAKWEDVPDSAQVVLPRADTNRLAQGGYAISSISGKTITLASYKVKPNLAKDDKVQIAGVIGMEDLNGKIVTLTAASGSSLTMDTAAEGTYVSGGVVLVNPHPVLQDKLDTREKLINAGGPDLEYPAKPATEDTIPEEAGTYSAYWNQPTSRYGAQYPYNKVFESESGHIKEYDDTPGAERIHEYHRAGTFYEIDPNGMKVDFVKGDNYNIRVHDDFLYVKGKIVWTGDDEVLLHSNDTMSLSSKWRLKVASGGDIDVYTKRNLNLRADGDINMEAGGNINLQADVMTSEDKRYAYAAGTRVKETLSKINLQAGIISLESPDPKDATGGLIEFQAKSKITQKVIEGDINTEALKGAISFLTTDGDITIQAGKGNTGNVNIVGGTDVNLNSGGEGTEVKSIDIAEINLTVPKDAVTLSGINTETRDNERSLIKT